MSVLYCSLHCSHSLTYMVVFLSGINSLQRSLLFVSKHTINCLYIWPPCTVYTVCISDHPVQCTLCVYLTTLYSVHCVYFWPPRTVYTVFISDHPVQCTLWLYPTTLNSVHCLYIWPPCLTILYICKSPNSWNKIFLNLILNDSKVNLFYYYISQGLFLLLYVDCLDIT